MVEVKQSKRIQVHYLTQLGNKLLLVLVHIVFPRSGVRASARDPCASSRLVSALDLSDQGTLEPGGEVESFEGVCARSVVRGKGSDVGSVVAARLGLEVNFRLGGDVEVRVNVQRREGTVGVLLRCIIKGQNISLGERRVRR